VSKAAKVLTRTGQPLMMMMMMAGIHDALIRNSLEAYAYQNKFVKAYYRKSSVKEAGKHSTGVFHFFENRN
jgi:hypothetical protein